MQHIEPGLRRSPQPRDHSRGIIDSALENLSYSRLTVRFPIRHHAILNEPIPVETRHGRAAFRATVLGENIGGNTLRGRREGQQVAPRNQAG